VIKQTTEHKERKFKGLTPLKAPVPPMLAKAIGYKGEARFVSFQWTPYGDEADYSDGRMSGTGDWHAFLAYIQHPAVSPFLEEYDLGSSESEAKHALILDREQLEIFIAPVIEVETFLIEQWRSKLPIHMSHVNVPKISIIKSPHIMSHEEVQRWIKEEYSMIEDMQRWLDKFLKN
jgi:hypothetical protein